MEQVPNPENCIRLSNKRDALRQRKAIVDWRINPEERATAMAFARMLHQSLASFPLLNWLKDQPITDTFHSMGGLRMGSDPVTSVVNSDLQLHGIPNLHVASCATSPSGGSSNPTFTLMALAMRLADHLAG